jgi:hypothetical protein
MINPSAMRNTANEAPSTGDARRCLNRARLPAFDGEAISFGRFAAWRAGFCVFDGLAGFFSRKFRGLYRANPAGTRKDARGVAARTP